ncbi:hypothetical protein C0Z46_24320 [Salmonella enterica]|nr:hypothetical protein [Salmonella enterica]EHQ4621853.1 hypothetical protein [Salmonella enterica]EID6668774.1 hypothetical protein [Salmonella enterica]
MKKLIIAAGIAAAVASFGASAKVYTSYASVNTTVTGDSGFQINATNGKDVDVNGFKASGADLGTFVVKAPVGATAFNLSDIHAHGYPQNYVVKIAATGATGTCVATVDAAGLAVLEGNVPNCPINAFTSDSVTLKATNNALFESDVTPGTKTLTVKFTSEVN